MNDKFSFKKGYRARSSFIVFNYIFLVIALIVMLVPIIKILSDSLDTSGKYGMSLIPQHISFDAYKMILTTQSLYRPFLISVYVTLVGTAISLFVCSMAAYVLVQEDMPGKGFLAYALIFAMLFSGGIIPMYITIKNLHMMNSLWAVILPGCISTYNVVLLKNFFEDIPKSLIEAAEIDGCTHFGTFIKIVLPMSKAALASIGLFFAVGFWNEFMPFVLYINDSKWYNFQFKLREMVLNDSMGATNNVDSNVYTKSLQNAAIFVAIVPFMIIYPFLQKYFVKGITVGAVKG
jgi:putative aldouronate transport system permease protein